MKHAHVPVPDNMRHLPVLNGYIKPWFVKDEDFRVTDERKAVISMREGKCWICGGKIRGAYAFVGGPKSTKAMMFTEPPCHKSCAQYAMQVCPFILYPKSKRRDAGLTEDQLQHSAVQDMENPGEFYITCVKKYHIKQTAGSVILTFTGRQVLSVEKWEQGTRVPQQ